MARVIRRRYLGGAAAALGGVLAAACGEVEIRYVQGPAGPAGPAGAQGERGATGAAGAQGQAGAAGQTIVVEKEKPVVVEKEVVKEVVVEKPVVVEKVVTVEKTASTGPKNITFDTDWGPSGPRAEVIKRAMALYNEMHPEVNVDVRIDAGREQAKSGSVFARTAVLIAADDMGDLFLWAGYVVVYWAKRGLFADLTPFMKQWGRTRDQYIGPPQHEIWPYPNGKIWGLPFQGGTGDYMYNKSVLDRHGIEPNENWTFDDLIETAKQVQDPENGLWGLTSPGWHTVLLTMYNIGGEKGADNGEKYLFDTPVGHQAIQFWEDLIHKHRIAPRPQDTRTEDGKSRGWSPWNGNYVFWTGYPSAAAQRSMEESNFEAQIMWAPKWPANGLRAVSGGDQPHMVTKFAGSRGVLAETAELANVLSGPEVSQIVVEHGNTAPIWKATFDSDANLDSARWRRDIIMDGFNYRFGNQAQEFWYPMYRAWNPIFRKVWEGEISGLAAAAEANRLNDVIVNLKTLHPTADVLQSKLS
ncbi:MAG: extracellular solute-binding protein [Rhodospirillaceae bacterium]|nr:extracellular solute-binding protein [Rhodospirillaceae bacterium]